MILPKPFIQFTVGILGSLFLLIGISGTVAYAAPMPATAAQGLQVSPALVELDADKGGTYTVKLQVTNITTGSLTYNTQVNDFTAKDETGTPQILLNSTLPSTSSIISWVRPIGSFTVSPHQTREINATLTVPGNAEPGGHYGVIRFAGASSTINQTGVGLSASAGVLFLVRVSGDITEKATIASFTTQHSNGHQTSFFENGPITFSTRIQNEGNVFLEPSGNIQIHNMAGGLTASLKVNAAEGNVLSSSIRQFKSTLSNKWLFGRYTADIAIGYGTKGEALTSETAFWVIPYRLILTGLAVLAALIFVFSRLIKRYNTYIISKSSHAKTTKSHKQKR